MHSPSMWSLNDRPALKGAALMTAMPFQQQLALWGRPAGVSKQRAAFIGAASVPYVGLTYWCLWPLNAIPVDPKSSADVHPAIILQYQQPLQDVAAPARPTPARQASPAIRQGQKVSGYQQFNAPFSTACVVPGSRMNGYFPITLLPLRSRATLQT